MANYYHEARAQLKSQKKHEESNRRRAERRAELASARVRPSPRLQWRPDLLTMADWFSRTRGEQLGHQRHGGQRLHDCWSNARERTDA